MMDRRTFGLRIFGGLAAAPASAQSGTPAGKIGYVHPVTISPNHVTLSILRRAWVKLGYIEGESVLLRSTDGDPARLPQAPTR